MLRKMCLLSVLLLALNVTGQNFFSATRIDTKTQTDQEFEKELYDYQLYSIDVAPLVLHARHAKNQFFSFTLDFDSDETYTIDLAANDLRASGYTSHMYKDGVYTKLDKSPTITFKGDLKGKGDSWVRMTMYEDYISGAIYDSKETVYFNSVDRTNKKGNNTLIFYKEKDIKNIHSLHCGYEEVSSQVEAQKNRNLSKKQIECVRAEVYLVADGPATNVFGGTEISCRNKMQEILNLVNQHYDPIEAEHTIIGDFIVIGTAPWNVDVDPGDHLEEVLFWADDGGPNQGGTPIQRDILSFWSNERVDWSYAPGAICDPPFSTNPIDGKRMSGNINGVWGGATGNVYNSNIQGHELGHNWGSGHFNGTLMDPTVPSGASGFGSGSIAAIQDAIPSFTCLSACVDITTPPVAAFSWNPAKVYEGTTVTIFDESTLSPNAWSWTFQGANINSSTDKNPAISFATEGTYDVTLIATNSIGASQPLTQTITVLKRLPCVFSEDFENISNGSLGNWTQEVNAGINFSVQGDITHNFSGIGVNFVSNGHESNKSISSGSNWDDTTGGPVDLRLISPSIDLTNVTDATLFFHDIRGWDNSWPTTKPNHSIQIQAATSASGPWTDIGSVITSQSDFESWVAHGGFDLSAFDGQTVYLSFLTTTHHYYWRIDTICIAGDNPLSVEDNETEDLVTVYPNPSTGRYTVRINTLNPNDFSMEIFDVLGQRIEAKKHTEGEPREFIIDLSKKATGIYYLRLSNSKSKQIIKLVKL